MIFSRSCRHTKRLSTGIYSGTPSLRTEIQLIEPVLQIAVRSSGSLRRHCLRLLCTDLTEEMVDRLVRVGCAEKDPEVFRPLLAAKHLPAAREVMRAILEAGLSTELADALRHAAGRVEFGDSELLRLAEERGAEAIGTLLDLAAAKIKSERCSGPAPPGDAGRFLAGIAFCGHSADLRARAYSELRGSGGWVIFTAAAIREVFDGPRHFTQAILSALRKPEPREMVQHLLEELSERWAEVAGSFTADRHTLADLVDCAARLAREDSESTMCREASGRLLATLAMARPKLAMPHLSALLRERGRKYEHRHIPDWLLAAYDSFVTELKSSRKIAADFADALAGIASGGSDPAVKLLGRLAADFSSLEDFIAARLGPAPDDFPAGFSGGSSSEAAAGDVNDEPGPATEMDDAVLMPDASLKTLAEYVAFMKAMELSRNPISFLASRGITPESFAASISAWSDLLGKDNRLALRYVELMRPEAEPPGSSDK